MIRAPMKRWFLLLIPLIGLAGCAPSGAGGVDTGRFKGDAKAVAQTLDYAGRPHGVDFARP